MIVDGLDTPGTLGNCPRDGSESGPDVIDGLTFGNGEVRNIHDAVGVRLGGHDITFTGNSFHGLQENRVCGADPGTWCMRLAEVPGFTLKNNRFIGCPTEGVIFTNWHVSNYGDVLIEGNVFGHVEDASQDFGGASTLEIASSVGQLDDWDVRYNTFETATNVANLSGTGSDWKGNLGGGNGCVAAFTYSYNVGETCGGTGDVPVSPAVNTPSVPDQAPFYVDAPGDDFHLGAGSAAIGAGAAADHPATDLEGHIRLTPDAGAHAYLHIAELWIDADGGTCTRASGEGVYDDDAACASFSAAYSAASSGDTIKIVDYAGGDDYGAQTIPARHQGRHLRGRHDQTRDRTARRRRPGRHRPQRDRRRPRHRLDRLLGHPPLDHLRLRHRPDLRRRHRRRPQQHRLGRRLPARRDRRRRPGDQRPQLQ